LKKPTNFIQNLPSNTLGSEIFQTLFENQKVKIERIISYGKNIDSWYDQKKSEFVMLIEGEAKILFEGEEELHLTKMDYLIIEPHQKHKVTFTSEDAIWLCLFF